LELRRSAFLDRDGVINVSPHRGHYIRTWEEFRLIPEAIEMIRLFNALDLLVIVVTNQRGVSRGLIHPAELERIHANMLTELARLGAHIDDVFCCPHDENTCDCRKPKPGLVLQAANKWHVDLPRSIMLGDSPSDRQLAEACGMRFVALREGRMIGILPDEANQPIAAIPRPDEKIDEEIREHEPCTL
jgi:D-glycero-D-manno-heptose 1,7-bisphosphate phosphatase